MKILNFYFILLLSADSFGAVDIAENLNSSLPTSKVRIVVGSDIATRYKNIENLKTELQLLEQQWKDFIDNAEKKQFDVQQQINQLKSISDSKSSYVYLKKINTLQKLHQILLDIKDIKGQILDVLIQHIEFWDKYFSDTMHQSNILEEKSIYSFLDFQNMTKKLSAQEDQLSLLFTKQEDQSAEISREEHAVASKEREVMSIEQTIEERKKQSDLNKEEIALLDLEKEVAIKERELAALRLSLYQKNQEFLSSKESVLQERLQQLKDYARIVRNQLYIDISDVQYYEHKNIEQKKISTIKKNELIKLRNEIATKKMEAQEELDRLRNRFKITFTTMKQLEDAEIESYGITHNFAFYSVVQAYVNVVTYERILQKIKASMLFHDVILEQSQIVLSTVKLLYEIAQGQIKDTETFEKERNNYKNLKQTLIADIKNYKEQIIAVNLLLKDGQKILARVRLQLDNMQKGGQGISASYQKKWIDCFNVLHQVVKSIEEQHEIVLQSSEIYDRIVISQEESLECINVILHEFDIIGVWHRSMSAVTWAGIKNIFPNLLLFVKGIYTIVSSYVAQFTIQKFAYALSNLGIGGLVGIFFILFCLFFLYMFLQALLPTLYKSMTHLDQADNDLWNRVKLCCAVIIGFVLDVFKPLYAWTIFVISALWYNMPIALMLIFYAYSIVFWIYGSRILLAHIIFINRRFDYLLLSKRLIDRFSFIFSFFSIATIIILVFRKMFLVVMSHQQSELPSILLRMYHLVIFTSIIFSIDKEELLQILPTKSALGQRIASIVDRYYYVLLVAIFGLLIMSDPYLGGYGTLMWHMFWNLLVTSGVLIGLFILHMLIRQYSAVFFFQEDENTLTGTSERFDYAKTWYAIYVLFLMLVFMLVAVVLCAEVWGYGFTYGTVRKIVMYELFKIETVNSTGKTVFEPFKILNLAYIIWAAFVGVMLAYAVKRFVLKRVFDIQYVDPGIQNTVFIISRYLIIIIAVMIACVQSKLGYFVYYISVFGLATFGWSFKDLFTDFVAYFFILVQRPVKLGDYVKIDDVTMGVVRKVSPRAVILRYRNAVNIVVPNSTILKASLYNWNYTRSYIGLDDIFFCVPFGTNIQLVREICLKVLDEDMDVLKVPQAFVRLENFEDKGYLFLVRGFVSSGNTLRQWDITSNLRFALVEQLAKAGISIAAPSVKIFMQPTQVGPQNTDQRI